ncbi:MAG TPA: SDR family oxidoreductase [Anaerolineales bacterium]|nr:SDR family oxidoreductase [Anaerolineales bacterium]
MINKNLVLVTGATGYVGGRLVPELLQSGYQVRVLVRDAARLEGRSWLPNVEVSVGDVLDPDTLATAMKNVEVAYYMIHSMKDSHEFHQRDLIAAGNFGTAARDAHVKRIIYLGGLGEADADLSQHLRSRQETGEILRQSGVPVSEFRAAIIVGSGSISFEMIRYLTERLPIMICPQWVFTRVQPIGISDVLLYLVAALRTPQSAGRIIEIGGEEVLTYGEMMTEYASVRGLSRRLIPVPVLTPRLSSHWVHWITPIPSEIAQPLIEGLRNEVILHSDLANEIFPHIKPMGYRLAVERALDHLRAGYIESSWSDSLASSQGDIPSVVLTTREGMIVEKRQRSIQAPPEAIYREFSSLGGKRGWLYMDWAWRLRGAIDRIFGGVGLRRGRRHPSQVRAGDALDFWRVEAVEFPSLIRLRAEMKVPGDAWLQFEVYSDKHDNSNLIQTAYFAPKGLAGFLYWYLLYPIHSVIFLGLINTLAANVQKDFAEDNQSTVPTSERTPIAIPVASDSKRKR